MPIHEFLCRKCGQMTDAFCSGDPRQERVDCGQCGELGAEYAGLSAPTPRMAKAIGPIINGQVASGPWGRTKRHKDRVKVFR